MLIGPLLAILMATTWEMLKLEEKIVAVNALLLQVVPILHGLIGKVALAG